MTPGLRETAAAWLAQGRPAMEVQVLRHRGSVPREAGTRMLVAVDAVAGTIGGGHLELQAIRHARELLGATQGRSAGPALIPTAHGGALQGAHAVAVGNGHPMALDGVDDRDIALGPSLGQCCGGALTLRTRWLSAATLADWPLPAPRFHLQLYGAGHVGRAIAALLGGIDCVVDWIDERETEFPPDAGPPHVRRLAVEPVAAEVRLAPAGAFYLVLTHSHDLDLHITEAVLRRGDFAWLGLIGSKTKRERFRHRLEDRGVPAAALARLTCPIGLPGVPGKEPEVIAVSVVAQMLKAAAGG